MLSTTAPATARLVSNSACDNSGSENLSSARAGSNTTPPVNARRGSDMRITATAR